MESQKTHTLHFTMSFIKSLMVSLKRYLFLQLLEKSELITIGRIINHGYITCEIFPLQISSCALIYYLFGETDETHFFLAWFIPGIVIVSLYVVNSRELVVILSTTFTLAKIQF